MAELTMPRLSDTMTEGTVGRWLKQPGDTVAVGDIVAEIETDKATMELEAYEAGTLTSILVPEGQTVAIGTPIGMIGDGSAAPAAAPAAPAPAQADAPATSAQQAPSEEGGNQAVARTSEEAKAQTGGVPATVPTDAGSGNGQVEGERVKASPIARRIAEQNGIDLSKVEGTGPGGRILKENVEAYMSSQQATPAAQPAPAPAAAPQAAAPAPAPQPAQPAAAPRPAGEVVPMSRMRRAIARAMTDSKPGVPHIYITSEVDMGAAMALRKQINDSGASEAKISPNDLVVKAVAKALMKFPQINSSFATTTDGQPGVIAHQQVNVSVAVATENGLLAPVVRDADKKSLGTIASDVKEMAGRARENKIKPNDLESATFQTSNLGMFDVVEFVSIITVPQAASLAIGAVRQVPVVREGQLAIGEMMRVTLSVDHRVADGAIAAQFLQEVKRLLQTPLSLLV